jgi:uncharacterized damage-inducible protein DinB
MEITTIESFLIYYERIRERTLNVIHSIPPEKLEWTYKEGKFTLGDIIRHIATTERYMFAENIQGKPSIYPGCGKELASGYDNTLKYFNDLHKESVNIFRQLSPEDLKKECITPGNTKIAAWKWLRAMVEHEIHHRAQIFTYLGMIGVTAKPLYGLTSEQVLEASKKQQ